MFHPDDQISKILKKSSASKNLHTDSNGINSTERLKRVYGSTHEVTKLTGNTFGNFNMNINMNINMNLDLKKNLAKGMKGLKMKKEEDEEEKNEEEEEEKVQ